MASVDGSLFRERLAAFWNADDDSDWEDVCRRARTRRRWFPAAAAAAIALLLALAFAPGVGLGGKIIGLFADRGEPVRVNELTRADRAMLLSFCSDVELVTRPGKAPEKRCRGGAPKIDEIANDGKRFTWKVTFPGGATCIASGSVRPYHDLNRGDSHVGRMSCASRGRDADRLLPSPKRPITVELGGSFSAKTRVTKIYVDGLAGQGVASVGLVETDGSVLKAPVKGSTYTLRSTEMRPWVAIAAYDELGKEVYREPLRGLSGFERRPSRVPRPRPLQKPKPPPPPPLPELPSEAPLQRAEAGGVAVDVYRSGFVAVRFGSTTSSSYRLLDQGVRGTKKYEFSGNAHVSVGCAKLAYGAGTWASIDAGTSTPLRRELRFSVSGGGGRAFGAPSGPSPPFDACWATAPYGVRWGNPNRMHYAVEVPFTPLGRRYFGERAAARDLAYFVRSPKLSAIRDAMKHRGVAAPSARSIAARFRARVLPVRSRTAGPPAGYIGVWSDRRSVIVASTRAPDGRRFYITLQRGRIGARNTHRLAYVF